MKITAHPKGSPCTSSGAFDAQKPGVIPYTTSSPNAYQNGDTFKIIKDGGATEKDYSDFFEGFESIYEDYEAQRKPGDFIRKAKDYMSDFSTLRAYPQESELYRQPYTGKDRHTELYGEKWGEGLDAASDTLAIASIIPGLDTYADLAAIPDVPVERVTLPYKGYKRIEDIFWYY